MKVDATHQVDRAGVSKVSVLAVEELGWLCREQAVSDVGIDVHLEVVTESGEATGRLLAVQIKSGASFFGEPSPDGWWFRCDDDHVTYWLNHSLPVVVMLFDPASKAVYWQHVVEETVVRTGMNFKINIPAAQRFTADARTDLAAPARQVAPIDPLTRAVDVLPAAVRTILLNALEGDPEARPDILRMARDLAETDDAGSLVAKFLHRTPQLVAKLPEEQTSWAWHAVGAYAVAHQLGALTVSALAKAAEVATTNRARLYAIAALTASHYDRDRAPELISEARDEQPLLAAIAQHVLDYPNGDQGRLPEVVAEAMRRGDPAADDARVWAFAAGAHLVAHRVAEAAEALRRALQLAPQDPGLQESLATTLVRNATSGSPELSHLDLRHAVSLATASRAEYRRWKGPSGEAAATLLRARAMTDGIARAVHTAMPAPEGEAEGHELDYQPLLLEGARMALRGGLAREARVLTERISDAGARAHLRAIALQAQPGSSTTEDAIAAWSDAIEAATDDELRFAAVRELTGLGAWPVPALDALHESGALSDALYEIQQARAEAAQGETAAAIRRLRHHESTSVAAAAELIMLYRDSGDLSAAAQTADSAGSRYQDLALRQFAVELWYQSGQSDQARLKAVTLLSRPDLPHDSRRGLRRALVEWAFEREDWTDMEDHALAGVAENVTPGPQGSTDAAAPGLGAVDFAWAAIRAQIGARRLDAAWHTYISFAPAIRQIAEAHLWHAVVQWHGWTSDLVDTALDLAERFQADTELTSSLLGELLRETGRPSPGDHPASDEATFAGRSLILSDSQNERFDMLLQGLPASTSGLHRVPFDLEALRQFVEETYGFRQPVIDLATDAVRAGEAPMGMLAMAAGIPVALAYARRAAGLTPIANFNSPHHNAEIQAARAALNNTTILDLSAISVTTLIPHRFSDLRAVFTETPTSSAARDDLINTRYAIDGLMHASGHLGVHDGQLTLTELTTADRAHLNERLQALSEITPTLAVKETSNLDSTRAALKLPTGHTAAHDGPWIAAAHLARETENPLWCDDAALRSRLHEAGVATFGTLALLHVLTQDPAYPDFTAERQRDDINTLLRAGAVDLPFRLDDLLAVIKDGSWKAGEACLVFVSPSFWGRPDSEAVWQRVVTELWDNAQEELPNWFQGAAYGITGLTPPDGVLEAVAALAASTVAEVGLGPEPWGAIRDAAHASLATCFQAAVRRTGNAPPSTSPSEDDFQARLQELLQDHLARRKGFAAGTAQSLINHMMSAPQPNSAK